MGIGSGTRGFFVLLAGAFINIAAEVVRTRITWKREKLNEVGVLKKGKEDF